MQDVAVQLPLLLYVIRPEQSCLQAFEHRYEIRYAGCRDAKRLHYLRTNDVGEAVEGVIWLKGGGKIGELDGCCCNDSVRRIDTLAAVLAIIACYIALKLG